MDIEKQDTQERMLFKNASWDKIREAVRQEKEVGFPARDVDKMLDQMMLWMNKVLQLHCLRAKPSSYTKRWYSEDLTALRRSYIYWRN
jgi:hypothetical protein